MGICLVSLFMVSCEEDRDESDCLTCTNCTGNGQFINGVQQCVEDFDNRSDWETFKSNYELQFSCSCAHNRSK